MSRRHCRSARREARPSKLRPLEPRGKHHGCQNRSHTNIYSLAHVMGMLPRTYHHCHSTRRGTRPSNYALSNDERPAAALTSPMTLIHPSIYMSGKQSNVASSLSQRPGRESRPSDCALSNNERLPTARTLPSVDIYSCVPSSSRIAAHCQLSWEECTCQCCQVGACRGYILGRN